MDHYRKSSLLFTYLCIVTPPLLTEKQTDGQESYDWELCRFRRNSCRVDEYPVQGVLRLQKYFALNHTSAMTTNITCEDQSSHTFRWYKEQMCRNGIRRWRLCNEGVLFFGDDFNLTDQGKYTCFREEEEGQNSNGTAVIVTFQGVTTYLANFSLQRHTPYRGVNQEGNCSRHVIIQGIEDNVKNKVCPVLQADPCGFYVQYITGSYQSEKKAVGYFFLNGSQNTAKLEETVRIHFQNECICIRYGEAGCFKTNVTFQSASFCEKNYTAGNLTFPRTSIGTIANSIENCTGTKPPKPIATRLCRGDFITASWWDDPIRNNCTNDTNTLSANGMGESVTGSSSVPNQAVSTSTYSTTTGTTQHSTQMTGKGHETTVVTSTTDGDTPKMIVGSTKDTKEPRVGVNDSTPVTKQNVNEVSRVLSENTKNAENINSTYLMWISERVKNISEVGSSSELVTSDLIEIIDSVLSVKKHVYDDIISTGAPLRILRALETQLTHAHMGGMNFTNVRSSLGVAAIKLEQHAFEDIINFGGYFPEATEAMTKNLTKPYVITGKGDFSTKYQAHQATISLPANLLDKTKTEQNESVPVTFIIHRTSLLFMSCTPQHNQKSERIESFVIAATVEGHNISNLSSPVISSFRLSHGEDTMTKAQRRCVFWDFTLDYGCGGWSSEGCELVSRSTDENGSIVECHCNHLTNFAVLLDVQGDFDHPVLDFLSIIGCVVSIVALIITLIVLLAVKKLREQVPQKIIINLCFALLGLYICFLIGIDQSSLEKGCVIFGALIHYFCLASVAWMSVVATNMYFLFVRVFNADVSGFVWKACVAAWGLPMVVVVVFAILKHQNYASSYCFPQSGTLTFYLGVLLLIALMLCYNLIIFILIIRQVTCGRLGKPAGQDKRKEMFERAQSIIVISVLLGLTWVFGFLSIGGARFIFNLLFLIFNSLQGLFVFVFFVLRPKNVRMILFKGCYRSQDTNAGVYTVNKSQTGENSNQKDTLDLDDIVVSNSQA